MTDERGSSLVAVMAALAVVSALTVAGFQMMRANVIHMKFKRTVAEANHLADGVKNHYTTALSWPVSLEALQRDGYVSTIRGLDGDWRLETDADIARIYSDVSTPTIALAIAGMLPQGTASSERITVSIPRPGDERIHAMFYFLDGSRALTGTMNAADNNIEQLNEATYK